MVHQQLGGTFHYLYAPRKTGTKTEWRHLQDDVTLPSSTPESRSNQCECTKEKGENCSQSQDDPVVPSSMSTVIEIDEHSPDPPSWVKIESCFPDSKLILYQESKSTILNKTGWLDSRRTDAPKEKFSCHRWPC